MKTSAHGNQDPINNPLGAGLGGGFRRPSFRRDAPRWVTFLVFAFFLGMILIGFLFAR
jgi:hypothetical protein